MSKIKPASSSESWELLTITAQDGQYLSKLVDKDCNTISSYDKCYKLNFRLVDYTNFHDVLAEIFERKETAFLTGGPTDFLKAELEVEHRLQRRLLRDTSGIPTVKYRDGCEFSLDLDDVKMPGFDPSNPVPAIKALAQQKRNILRCHLANNGKPEANNHGLSKSQTLHPIG